LFKKVPSLEQLDAMRNATDQAVVMTLRGIGEMTPHNPDSFVDPAKSANNQENAAPASVC